MYQKVLQFWFEEIRPDQWWTKDPLFDQLIKDTFSSLHVQANRGELYAWRQTPKGRLAEIIVLDQFSRNMYRDSPQAFSSDSLALALCQEAVTQRADTALTRVECSFLYMPMMHSESLLIHEMALPLFKRRAVESSVDYEYQHKAIIEQFGRYPHRNAILGRESTADEIAFLKQPNSHF
ncbi:DUF924 family protein [uncultured Shewanella sp.]|uniref:DUF924 family protein n=1 Tax=uncultured Shewanella sp. TaxID=173975 RepID=UPI0026259AA7|nr:DUF924 family protein [uncultured Shewanella sp.]